MGFKLTAVLTSGDEQRSSPLGFGSAAYKVCSVSGMMSRNI
jgi:hypothetical protein